MTAEQIQTIQAAVQGGDPQMIEQTLKAFEADAMDRAAGVEDTAAQLKTALAAKKEALEAARKEVEEWAKLGDRDAVKAAMAEAAEAKAQAEAAAADAKAQAVGANPADIERLVAERTQAQVDAVVGPIRTRAEQVSEENASLMRDRETLVSKLEDALLRHQMYVAVPDANPTLFPYLMDKAREYHRPKVDDPAKRDEWWRQSGLPEFEVYDPKTDAPLKDGNAPLTTKQLVDAKPEWQIFKVPTGKGGGMATTPQGNGKTRLDHDAPVGDYINALID